MTTYDVVCTPFFQFLKIHTIHTAKYTQIHATRCSQYTQQALPLYTRQIVHRHTTQHTVKLNCATELFYYCAKVTKNLSGTNQKGGMR